MPNESARLRPWSLALRITLVVSLTMSVVFAASAWLVSRSIEGHFEELDFGELQAVTDSLGQALAVEPNGSALALRERVAQAVAGHHGVYFAVLDGRDQPIYARAPDALLDAARRAEPVRRLAPERLAAWSVGADTYRGGVLTVSGHRVLVAVSTDAHEHYLARLRQGLWRGALAATALAVLAVCIAVRWGHAPIRRIGASMRGVTSDNLDLRLEPQSVPAELTTLVTSFNAMLDQLQASFERLSHFSADIAHELRTPVTNLMTQTQVALSKERSPVAYREVLYTGLDELDRMRKMIGDMLFLAQTENPRRRLQTAEVRLEAEVQAVFDYFEALSEEAGVGLRLDSTQGGVPAAAGDRGMLQRAISNLVGNALRHTERGQTVVVRLLAEAGSVRVEVENPGAAIDSTHLPHLFDRFYRVDPARHREGEGAGLGLAIVKAIAEAHGGAVGVSSSDGMNRFWLQLPVARPAPLSFMLAAQAARGGAHKTDPHDLEA
ncbi:heavy metal sensor histidine kinase [Rubrivivax albus]|uniref:Sensor protein n=1 Tax=Rubrivivax albus TaxID=2499835 RepID=A0A3S3SBH1_9BURK|nr:heavy metal sensor histidine kinase [Rubrivivax albus]RVT50582.1 HAMP domain-containing protein [Rubrivivax albus]